MQTAQLAFAAGLILFLGAHLFSAFRDRTGAGLAGKLGAGPYMGIFSVLSLIGLVLIVWGYGGWRNTIAVWDPPVWSRHLALTFMLPALIALAAAYLPTGYIKKTARHPMLVAVKIWALAHLVANGDLASVILFASFLAFAVVDRIALKSRPQPEFAAPSIMADLGAIAIGAAAYAVIALWAHQALIGVPVLS